VTRLRDLGVAIGPYEPGRFNAITDVAGVCVGHTTLIRGDGPLVLGQGPVRTGVTVILPRDGSVRERPLFAGSYTLNGAGDFAGLEWVRESGLLTTPIAITNTHSLGVVRDALVAHEVRNQPPGGLWFAMPTVAETYDGLLNDIDGQHVTAQHVFDAIAAASDGPVAEGNVGGGTGMLCHGFKGGIGTSSRVLPDDQGGWTVGVLVQANYGRREDLHVAGVPVGQRIPAEEVPTPGPLPVQPPPGTGSIIIVVATDAPLLPDQCRRLAVRAGVGLSRVGGGTGDTSGDIFLAFSTGNTTIPPDQLRGDTPLTFGVETVSHQRIAPLLQATSDATEEAIVNAMLAAETMVGRDGITAHALDAKRLRAALDA
jgi:D-aminopeptidase